LRASTCWWLILFVSVAEVGTLWFTYPPHPFLAEIRGFSFLVWANTRPNSDRVSCMFHYLIMLHVWIDFSDYFSDYLSDFVGRKVFELCFVIDIEWNWEIIEWPSFCFLYCQFICILLCWHMASQLD
jgi:hypothetical protein